MLLQAQDFAHALLSAFPFFHCLAKTFLASTRMEAARWPRTSLFLHTSVAPVLDMDIGQFARNLSIEEPIFGAKESDFFFFYDPTEVLLGLHCVLF